MPNPLNIISVGNIIIKRKHDPRKYSLGEGLLSCPWAFGVTTHALKLALSLLSLREISYSTGMAKKENSVNSSKDKKLFCIFDFALGTATSLQM